MAKRFIRPQFWPTVMTIPIFLLVAGLGLWQMQRLEWKNALIENINRESAGVAAVVPETDVLARMEKDEYRHVLLRGVFLHDKELHRAARYHRGQLGYHVVTPMVLEDGRVMLVVRGWVPESHLPPERRAEGQVEGVQEIRAMIAKPIKRGLFFPENNAHQNIWFWFDLPAMEAATGLTLLPVVADAVAVETPGGLPIAATGKIELKNDHLYYAVTWFCLALSILVIYALYHRRDA